MFICCSPANEPMIVSPGSMPTGSNDSLNCACCSIADIISFEMLAPSTSAIVLTSVPAVSKSVDIIAAAPSAGAKFSKSRFKPLAAAAISSDAFSST